MVLVERVPHRVDRVRDVLAVHAGRLDRTAELHRRGIGHGRHLSTFPRARSWHQHHQPVDFLGPGVVGGPARGAPAQLGPRGVRDRGGPGEGRQGQAREAGSGPTRHDDPLELVPPPYFPLPLGASPDSSARFPRYRI